MLKSKKLYIASALVIGVAMLAGLIIAWRLGCFTERLDGFTDRDWAEMAARVHGTNAIAQPMPEAIDSSRPVRLALGSIGLNDERQARNITDLVLTELSSVPGIEPVERQELDLVLREMQLSSSGIVRASHAIRVGKLLRADWFLLGTPAVVNGTNVAVIRVVDARTGVMREATMIPAATPVPDFTARLASFVRQARIAASHPSARTYLSVGLFEDLSLNSRQAALPRELRSYLAAAYQNSGVVLLEREFVYLLLREVYLDLDGLTEEGAEGARKPMQAAYWMLDGSYQSYETTNHLVEVVMNVRRFMGRTARTELREEPGEALFSKIKGAIDRAMAVKQSQQALSRQNEIQSLLIRGKELASITSTERMSYIWPVSGASLVGHNEWARRVRNAEEAVRAFETILLLDPPNREARMCLATCFRSTLVERVDEARAYYREVIDAPVEDRWGEIARGAVLDSFRKSDPDESRHWFEQAAMGTTNQAAIEFYQASARRAVDDGIVKRGRRMQLTDPKDLQELRRLAEARLFQEIQSFDELLHGKGGMHDTTFGLGDFAKIFGDDRARAARELAELFPRIKARWPDSAPYLLNTIVGYQTDTNAPIIAEFERTLEWAAQNPPQLKDVSRFWSGIHLYNWAFKYNMPEMAVKTLEPKFRAADECRSGRIGISDVDTIALAYGYVGMQRWEDALRVFDSLKRQPVSIGSKGPWGPPFSIVFPGKQAAICREKLGLPPATDPREFEVGKAKLCLHDPNDYRPYGGSSVLAVAPEGLWIGVNGYLMLVDYNFRTNLNVRLPMENWAALTALQVTASNLWVGTAGDGLFEFDRTSRTFRTYSQKDGLLMDGIADLRQTRDTLWIGYGDRNHGGLGKLDLQTRRFTSFTPALSETLKKGQPPARKVYGLQAGQAGEVWFLTQYVLSRYQPALEEWKPFGRVGGDVNPGCFIVEGERLIEGLHVGQYEVVFDPSGTRGTNTLAPVKRLTISVEELPSLRAALRTNSSGITAQIGRPPRGGLALRHLGDGSYRRLMGSELLWSPPTALALDGPRLWAAGEGYLALVNLAEDRIERIGLLKAGDVDSLHISDGFLWALAEKHIYRVSLQDVYARTDRPNPSNDNH